MSTITLHLNDGADLELDAEQIQPGARFILQTSENVPPDRLDYLRDAILAHLGDDIRFIIVSGAKVIPIPGPEVRSDA